jgi:hypothetical protein
MLRDLVAIFVVSRRDVKVVQPRPARKKSRERRDSTQQRFEGLWETYKSTTGRQKSSTSVIDVLRSLFDPISTMLIELFPRSMTECPRHSMRHRGLETMEGVEGEAE